MKYEILRGMREVNLLSKKEIAASLKVSAAVIAVSSISAFTRVSYLRWEGIAPTAPLLTRRKDSYIPKPAGTKSRREMFQ